jgi:hypothetical protein
MPSLVNALLLLLLSHYTPQVTGSCATPLVSLVEKLFNTSTPAGVAQRLLTTVQDECRDGECPRVAVETCQNQSVDDINCPMQVADVNVKLGTDAICDTGCSDWPCKAACQGIDVGICYGADYVLCKAGCLGISKCVKKCEHAIVDPCKKKLIDQCEDKCEAAFTECKEKCEKTLSMDISVEVDRMQRAVTSLGMNSLDVNCTGNQVMNDPLLFNASATLTLGDVSVDLKVHTKDAGISSTNGLNLDKVTLTANLPLNGKMNCVLSKEIDINVGSVTITAINLDVNLRLQKSLDTIVAVICADLPVCKDAIKNAISKAIKDEIEKQVPKQLAHQLTQLLQGLTSKLKCPKIPFGDRGTITI